jgi:hypothetical protein
MLAMAFLAGRFSLNFCEDARPTFPIRRAILLGCETFFKLAGQMRNFRRFLFGFESRVTCGFLSA